MLAPMRLLVLALLGLVLYTGFVAVPQSDRSLTAFDPEALADYQVAMWQASAAHQEPTIYLNAVRLLREQHRYTWFRAAQSGYHLALATSDFEPMTTRFERVLPDLEAVARIERAWRGAPFSEAEAARAQLNWWVALKSRDLRRRLNVTAEIARDFEIRYGIDAGLFEQSAADLVAAVELRDDTRPEPDWVGVRQLLVRSYRSLRLALERGQRVRHASAA